MNNFKIEIDKIFNQFKYKINYLNLKNINLNLFYNLQYKYNNKKIILKNVCNIIKINERIFQLVFSDINIQKDIIKKNYFEKIGFKILKKKNILEINIPNLSIELRNNFLKLLKNEYILTKEILEKMRKKIIIENKNKIESKCEILRKEKLIEFFFINQKNKLLDLYKIKEKEILNE